ncbi:hypothetical protein [Maridesulfovibrio ferrireducens]|nr:hypothetical protein [Maridesulfovibrio ferrireducens]MBI9109710.1 hypothetical protein [Maridesulfovibrio ferrireducens]
MPELKTEELEKRLVELMGADAPAHAAQDVNIALQAAENMKSKGYSFQMEDLCRRSMDDCMWRAMFSKDGVDFFVDDARAAVAVCTAIVTALDNS